MTQATFLLFILSFIVLLISYLLSRGYISAKMSLVVYIMSIFCVTFIYRPGYSSDLGRYFLILDGMQSIPLSQINYYGAGKNLFVINFVFWIIAKLVIYQLLPALSVSTVYGIGAYIIINSRLLQNKQTNDMSIFLLLQFMQLSFFGIMDNVRNIWAFSLIILAVYRELIQNKRNLITILLYILPCFMHNSAFLMVAFRLLIPFAKKTKYALPLLTLFVGQGIELLYLHLNLFPMFIANAINSSYQYLNNSVATEWGMKVASSSFFRLQRVIEMTMAIALLILFYLIQANMNNDMKNFSYFTFLILVAVLACNVFTAPHYWRYYSAAMLCVPVMINYSFSIRSRSLTIQLLQWSYIFLSLVMYSLNVWSAYSSY